MITGPRVSQAACRQAAQEANEGGPGQQGCKGAVLRAGAEGCTVDSSLRGGCNGHGCSPTGLPETEWNSRLRPRAA